MSVELSLYKAIKLCGSKQKNLATAIGESPDKIRYWLTSGKRVPFHNAIAIEAATGGKVSRFDLAPYARFHNNRINDIAMSEPQSASITTISERISRGIAYEKSLGNRNGKRNTTPPSENFHKLKGRTSELAAKKVGFKNYRSYLQAKKVVSQGISKLIEAMDNGSLAISSAALISEFDSNIQEIILQKDPKDIAKIIRTIRVNKSNLTIFMEEKTLNPNFDQKGELHGTL